METGLEVRKSRKAMRPYERPNFAPPSALSDTDDFPAPLAVVVSVVVVVVVVGSGGAVVADPVDWKGPSDGFS